MKFLQRVWVLVWADIKSGQNLDIYIAVALAVIVAILGVVKAADTTVIMSAVLATLALVLLGLLINRRQNEEILRALRGSRTTPSVADQFLTFEYEIDDVTQLLRSSQRIYFWGTTLSTHIPLLRDDIKQELLRGLEVRFLLIEPSSTATKMAAFRGKDLPEEELNSNLERNFAILAKIIQEVPAGKLEVRVVDYVAPYTMYIFDPHLVHGHLFVRLSTFHVPNVRVRPTFKLTHKDDKIWFEHFVGQFESLWNASKPYQVPNTDVKGSG